MTSSWTPIGRKAPEPRQSIPCDHCMEHGFVYDVMLPVAITQLPVVFDEDGGFTIECEPWMVLHQACRGCGSVHVHPHVDRETRMQVLRWDVELAAR